MTKTVTVTIRDAKGKTARVEANLPTGTGQVTATNFAEDLAVAIYNIISGEVIGLSITDNLDLPGAIEPGAGSTSDVEEGGLFVFRTENNYITKMRVPTLLESHILAGTNTVDLADTDVDTFVDLMVDGLEDIVNGDALPSDSRDDDIVSVASAKEDFRPR